MRPKKIGSARSMKLLFSFDPMELSRVILTSLTDTEVDYIEALGTYRRIKWRT